MLPTFFCRQQPAGCLKCTHMHAHTKSLPSGQAIFQKMYTFAGIFFRWFYVYTCILFFFSSPNFAGILPQQAYPQKCPSPTFTVFSHILHNTKQEEKSCKRKSNKHPLQFHQDKKQRGNRRTKENRKNTKIKEFVETKKCYRKPRFSPHVDKKQKKNKEKQRVNKDKYTKIYKLYFQIKKIEKMDILQEQNEKNKKNKTKKQTKQKNIKKDIKKDLDIFPYFFPICGRIKYVFFTKTKTYHINCVSTTHRKDLL